MNQIDDFDTLFLNDFAKLGHELQQQFGNIV